MRIASMNSASLFPVMNIGLPLEHPLTQLQDKSPVLVVDDVTLMHCLPKLQRTFEVHHLSKTHVGIAPPPVWARRLT